MTEKYSKFILSILSAINETELSTQSKLTIKSNLNKIATATHKTFIRDIVSVVKTIENINSQYTFLGVVKMILKNIDLQLTEKDVAIVEELFKHIKNIKEKKQAQTKLNPKQEARYIVSYSDLVKLTERLDGLDKLYYALYTYTPPLRLDYNAVYIIDTDLTKPATKINDLNNNTNYYSVKNNTFIINEYKASSSKEPIIFQAPTKLKNLIIKSLNDTPRKVLLYNGFKNTPNTPITPSYLSNRIKEISEAILADVEVKKDEDRRVGITDMRHLFLTEFYKDYETTDHIEKHYEDVAKKMGNSVKTAYMIYAK
jgi:sulfur relay (sulfurtransferase) DsrC/TusE family protein